MLSSREMVYFELTLLQYEKDNFCCRHSYVLFRMFQK
jgi:hypothetical protein